MAQASKPKPNPILHPHPGLDLRKAPLAGYVRDRQARLAGLIDKIKADHGEAAAPAIEKLAKRIELLNPVKDCEILRLIEALFM